MNYNTKHVYVEICNVTGEITSTFPYIAKADIGIKEMHVLHDNKYTGYIIHIKNYIKNNPIPSKSMSLDAHKFIIGLGRKQKINNIKKRINGSSI